MPFRCTVTSAMIGLPTITVCVFSGSFTTLAWSIMTVTAGVPFGAAAPRQASPAASAAAAARAMKRRPTRMTKNLAELIVRQKLSAENGEGSANGGLVARPLRP